MTNNDNEPIFIIKPGHYQTIDSVNSEKKNIIRILGPSSKREGFWLIDEHKLNGVNKEISESEIEQNYIALDTQSSDKKPMRKAGKVDIFAGFKPTKEKEQGPFVNEHETAPKVVISKPVLLKDSMPLIKEPTKSIVLELDKEAKAIAAPVKHLSFDVKIIEKISLENIREQYYTKYGTYPPTQNDPTIDVTIPIKLGYDLDKLRKTVELLDLDVNDIIHYIIENINTNDIMDALYNILLGIIKFNNPIPDSKHTITSPTPNIKIIVEEPVVEVVEEPVVEVIENEQPIDNIKTEETLNIDKEIINIDKFINNNL